MCKIQSQIGKDCLTSCFHLFELRKLGRREEVKARNTGLQVKELFLMGRRPENKKIGR